MKPKRSETIRKLGNSRVHIYPCKTGTGHPYFTLVFREAGFRKRETFADEDEVERRATEVLKILEAGRFSALELSRDDVDEYRAAKAEREGLTLSLAQIVRDHKAILAVLDGRSPMEAARYFVRMHPKELKPKLVADVADELYVSKAAHGKSAEYVGQLKHQCGKFARMFSKNISDVTADDLKLFIGSLVDLSPRTKNNVITGVRELFRFAKKQKYVPKDFDQLDGMEFFEDSDGEILIFTPQEMDKLMTNADPRIIPAMALSAFAGLRRSEVMKLDWSEVDLRRGFVTVAAHKAKTKARRLVPISKNLKAWLAPYVQRTGAVLYIGRDEHVDLMAEAASKSGFAWRKNALRHSFCSYRLAKTKDTAKVALEAGNSPAMLFKHYRELVRPIDARRWFAIAPKRAANVVDMRAAG